MKNELLNNNKYLKTKLKEFKEKIDSEFRKYKRVKIYKNEDEDIDIQKSIDFNNKIGNYKHKINEIKFNIYNSNTCLSVIKNEDLLYSLKEELINLKKENETLNKIEKEQKIGLKENSEKINCLNDKNINKICVQLKNKIKLLKECNDNDFNEMKIQENTIYKIQDYCKLINENIENKKKLKNNNISNIDNEIKSLLEDIKKNESLLQNQEKTYKKNITAQIDKINKLKEEINILKIQVEHIKKDETINLLKYKELSKLKENMNKKLFKSESEKILKIYNYKNNNNISFKNNNIPFEIGKFRNKSQDNMNINKIINYPKNKQTLKYTLKNLNNERSNKIKKILLNNIQNDYKTLNKPLFTPFTSYKI